MKKSTPSWSIIILLAVIKFVLPYVLQSHVYELQRDEYLYYEQGHHFDFGYLENPPLLSWMGMISSWFGGSVFWIKFWPCFFGAATLIVTCLITAEFGGRAFAQFVAGLAIIGGAFLRTHFLFQPNILDIFFWTTSIYFLVKYINTKKLNFIILLAISIALGLMSKYSILFTLLAIGIGLLLSPYRDIFTKRKTWIAAIILIILIIPNLLYQWYFNWPLLHHMKELQDTQLKYIDKGDFIKEQLLLLLPVLLVWILGLIWVFRKKEWRIIGIIYFTAILLLLFGSGKGYYALGAYPMLLAAGGVAWEQFSQRRKWIRYAITIWIIVINLLILPMLLPIAKPERLAAFYKKYGIKHKWEDQENHPLPQDFADMLGWKELAAKTESFFMSLPDSLKSNTYIYCSNYGQAGALKYYGKDKDFKRRIISRNGSFLLWIPDRFVFENIIFVNESVPVENGGSFKNMTTVDSVNYPLSRQLGNKIIFLEKVTPEGFQLFRKEISEAKQQFGH